MNHVISLISEPIKYLQITLSGFKVYRDFQGKGPPKNLTFFFLFLLASGGFPGGSVVKNPLANARGTGDTGSISWLGRMLGEENGNPLQCSCLENPMDRGTWWAIVYEVAKSRIRLGDSKHAQLASIANVN